MTNSKKTPKSGGDQQKKIHDQIHQHHHPDIPSKLTWLPKKTFELEITIPWELVKEEYQHSLSELAKNITVKGFRKGKAPITLAEKQIGKNKIYDKVINHVVGHAYYDSVVKHGLRPVIEPKIEPKSMEENKDWLIIAKACEMPQVKLGDYKKSIKNLKTKKPKDKKASATNIDTILKKLYQITKIEISDLLINEETDRILADTIDQIMSAGMTVDQYLKSRKLTATSHKEMVRKQAEQKLKQQFILSEVANDAKIKVEKDEIDKLLKTTMTKNPKVKESSNMLSYVQAVLLQQKTIDYLNKI